MKIWCTPADRRNAEPRPEPDRNRKALEAADRLLEAIDNFDGSGDEADEEQWQAVTDAAFEYQRLRKGDAG